MATEKVNIRSIRNRAFLEMASSAFFTTPSAIIIAVSIILMGLAVSPFSWWPPFFWLIFGLVGEAAYIFATLTDPQARAQTLEKIIKERYNPARIKNVSARARLEKALEYYSAIQNLMLTRSGASRVEFQNTLDDIDNWIEEIYNLGQRLDRFEANQIINRDRIKVRREIEETGRRIKAETDPRVKEELQRSLELRETQLRNLENLEVNAKRADIQLDNTLSALGTVYAQLQVIGSKDIDRGSAQRLRNEVHDHVMELQDTIAAIDEVQTGRAY